MAGDFTIASSQSLRSSTLFPATGYPMTIGAWVNARTLPATNQVIAGLGHSAAANSLFTNIQATTGKFRISALAAGTAQDTMTVGVCAVNTWNFVLGRFINATNRRLDVLFSGGATEHVQNTVSSSPAVLDTTTIGARLAAGSLSSFFDGLIGEVWFTNTDVQIDAAALDDSLLQQLAFGGPFSVPHVAAGLVEYRSLQKAPISNEIGQFYAAKASPTWINSNGVTIGPHPPLPYWYANPSQTIRSLVI